MEVLSFPLVLLQMHDTKINKCHLSPKGPSSLDSLACLCSWKKDKLRLLEVIWTEKTKKGSIALATEHVWALSNALWHSQSSALPLEWVPGCFCILRIHVLVSASLKLWLCCQSSLQLILTSSIFLSKREIPCPNFLIPLLLGILEEPAWTLFIVLKVSSHEMAQSGSDISQTT